MKAALTCCGEKNRIAKASIGVEPSVIGRKRKEPQRYCSATYLSHLKLTQLRYYLKEHNLKTSDNTKDLIKRIKDFQMLGH